MGSVTQFQASRQAILHAPSHHYEQHQLLYPLVVGLWVMKCQVWQVEVGSFRVLLATACPGTVALQYLCVVINASTH